MLKTIAHEDYSRGFAVSPAENEIIFFTSSFSFVPVWKEANPKCFY